MTKNSELTDSPTTAQLRTGLSAYVKAVADRSKQFRVFRYRTPIGILGHVDEMPDEYRDNALAVSFAEAREELKTITSTMLKGQAIILTRVAKVKAQAGRKQAGKKAAQIAAIWPVPQLTVVMEIGSETRRLVAEHKALRAELAQFFKSFSPVLRKFEDLGILDGEIAAKRKVAENLDSTIKRIHQH